MNKKIIVIVGASRGIGKAMVEIFASTPSNQVHAFSRNLQKMESQFGNLANVTCHAYNLEDAVSEQANKIFDKFERIDILINNAGKLISKPFTQLSHFDLTSSYQINVIGVMESVQSAIPKMLINGGHIVNISSMGGFQGSVKFSGLSAYSTSKAALVCFTELFAEEYKETKIKMNCLCLGAVQTEMLQEAFPGYQAPLSAEKMAEFIVDFALNGNQWMNGKILPVSLSTP